MSSRAATKRFDMKKILVSECLYGGRAVRYDGGIKEERHPLFIRLKEEGRMIPFCPEVYGGLPIPRTDCQRRGDRIISRNGRDCTDEYIKGARKARDIAVKEQVICAILKENSPSCGVEMIHDGNFDGVKIPGRGVTTEILQEAGIKVFSEKQIEEAVKFIDECEGTCDL